MGSMWGTGMTDSTCEEEEQSRRIMANRSKNFKEVKVDQT